MTVERPHAPRPRLPARLPVLRRAGAVAGQGAVGRRAQPPAAGAAVHAAGQRAGARRADQRSRSRNAGAARGAAGRVAGHAAARQPRPRVSSTTSSPARSCSRATAASRSTSAATRTGCASGRSRKLRSRSRSAGRSASRQRDRVSPATQSKKLSYKEQRELEGLPARIEALEAEQRALQRADRGRRSSTRSAPTRFERRWRGSRRSQRELVDAYARWHELESQATSEIRN